MNFTKIIIFIFLLISIFIIPVNADNLIQNSGFESGDFSGWTVISTSMVTEVSPSYAYNSNYGAKFQSYGSSGGSHIESGVFQVINMTNLNTITFDYSLITDTTYEKGFSVFIDSLSSSAYFFDDSSNAYMEGSINVSALSGDHILYFSVYGYSQNCIVYLDNVIADDYIPILMQFKNEPVKVGTYAHLDVDLFDYWDTHADEHFYLNYDYYYKNVSDYTIINYNELELNAQNTVNLIPTYYPYFNQTGGCEIKVSLLYTYRDPVYHEVDLGFITTLLINSTYEPPDIPEEPEEPEIPDPEPEPEPEPNPPVLPTQPNGTGANQSINVSWTGEYYIIVNDTFSGLCSPIYNFTNWSLSPVHSLNSSIGEFNYHMNESFMQTAQDSSILYDSINTIYGAIHPKIRNVITYYLIWVVLLIILKKD